MNRSSHHVHHQIAILEDPNNHQSEIIILFNIFDGIPSFLFLERPFSSEARRKVATPSARPGWCAYGDQQDRGLTMGLAINLVILPKKEREFIGLTMSKHHCHQYSAWYEESESERRYSSREREGSRRSNSGLHPGSFTSMAPLEPRGAVGISIHHRQQWIMVWLMMVSSDMWYANLPTSGPRLWVPSHWTRHFENSLRHGMIGMGNSNDLTSIGNQSVCPKMRCSADIHKFGD